MKDSVKKKLEERDGPGCVRCRTVENLTVDHIIPIVWGGNNHFINKQIMCESCNTGKSDNFKEEDVILERLKRSLSKPTRQHSAGLRIYRELVHDQRCDDDACWHTCPVYMEYGPVIVGTKVKRVLAG